MSTVGTTGTGGTTLGGSLPAPTGPFQVGRILAEWVDNSRDDIYASTAGAKRELVVWIWYPAAADREATPGAYLPGAWAATGSALDLAQDQVRAHAIPDAAIATDEASYPVLVFSPSGFAP